MVDADLKVFYLLNGQGVAQTPNALWYRPSPVAWSLFPYRNYPEIDESDYSKLWRSSRTAIVARAIRHPRDRETTAGALYLRRGPYCVGSLSSNTRSKVRRGLALNEIRRVDFDEPAVDGAALHVSTLRRQRRNVDRRSNQRWARTCSAAQAAGFDAWGSYHSGRLTALVLGFCFDGRYHLSHMCSAADSLRTYPNNALVYSITASLLATTDVHDVSYGLESVERNREHLNAFKMSMGFGRVPVHETVTLRPGARVLRTPMAKLATRAARAFPERDGFRKAAGLLTPDRQDQRSLGTDPGAND